MAYATDSKADRGSSSWADVPQTETTLIIRKGFPNNDEAVKLNVNQGIKSRKPRSLSRIVMFGPRGGLSKLAHDNSQNGLGCSGFIAVFQRR